jgi:hypothetical protein
MLREPIAVLVLVAWVVGAAAAQLTLGSKPASRTLQLETGIRTLRLPGTNHEFALTPFGHVLDFGSHEALLTAIADWLSTEFRLPVPTKLPKLRFATSDAMIAMRYGKDAAALQYRPDILALYDSSTRTIYLQRDWIGTSPAELSILVHEMVHYMQSEAGLRFDCLEAREALAFEAQAAWLVLFGTDLFEQFQLDSFTVWTRSTCIY